MSDVALLYDYFFGGGAQGSSEALSVDPDQAARDAIAHLDITPDEQAAMLVTNTMAALVRVSTAEMGRRRRRATERVADSVRSMNRIHRLALALNGLIFLTGAAFLIVAIGVGATGRLDDALVAGTFGVFEIAIGLLTRPQHAVNASALDQLQIQVAYNTFVHSLDQIGRHYDWQTELESLGLKDAASAMIFEAAEASCAQIEQYSKPSRSKHSHRSDSTQ